MQTGFQSGSATLSGNTTRLARIFFMACELRPALPEKKLLSYLGKAWSPMIQAGAQYGLGGCGAALPGVSADQLTQFFMAGCESGATPSIEEFQTALAGTIYEAIQGKADISALEQMQLIADLNSYLKGRESHNGDSAIDFDAVVETPMFTKTGFWPVDRIMGEQGVPQEVITLLARPETGKTTVCLSIAHAWRRSDIGEVVFIQTELAASAMRMKIDMMGRPGEKLWRTGQDRLVFGRREAEKELRRLIDAPDPNRLVIFDSIGGHCGQGDTPDSRSRFADLYDLLMATKNQSRMVIAAGHVKRGVDIADIESAAGSSAVERFSGGLIYFAKDPAPFPNGRSEIRIETLKNRYAGRVRPFSFSYDYKLGDAFESDEFEDDLEELT